MTETTGIQVTVNFNDQSLMASIMRIIRSADDPSPIMKNLATAGEVSTRKRFENQAGPDGTPWKKSLRAQITGSKTLIKDGHLLDSITSDSGRDWAAWGTNRPYGPIHQLGGVIKPKTAGGGLRFRLTGGAWIFKRQVVMPARPYLGVNEEDESNISEIVMNSLRSKFLP